MANIVCHFSLQQDRRQEPTAITELSGKMYLLCKNGKHSLQFWKSVSLNTKSFLIGNPILDFLQKSRKESIQIGLHRLFFLSVQVKPICPSSWFQGLTNNPQNMAKSRSWKLSTKKYKEYQPHVLAQLCHQGHRMNASEKNKKRNKNYNIRSKENEEKRKERRCKICNMKSSDITAVILTSLIELIWKKDTVYQSYSKKQ